MENRCLLLQGSNKQGRWWRGAVLVEYTTCELKRRTAEKMEEKKKKKRKENLSGANSAACSNTFTGDPADYEETRVLRI